MNITHFTLDEFVASQTATAKGIDNTLPDALVPNAWGTLALLETIRAHLSDKAGHDVPIIIVSGYRCPELNEAVGGVASSDHCQGMAADFHAPSFGTPYEIACELASCVSVLGIGQLINEFADSPNPWVHVSTRVPEKAVNRIITINSHGTEVGIVK